ncbi:DUF6402 family protein [Paraburkholderia pallida]|uniref:Uncharacterized protein n=1 Tax=Paraburkholderia pallida TaxID=2547399 RepID=A0A4P7CLS5_9BURK|nr:DUF6402 family protein [Paraburkholderia pallida]QBQ95787.1 hypothetical protein E1956_00435 [Paraburkholderia pallida]
MLYLTDKEIPYYKTGFWKQRWNPCEGCKPVSVEGLSPDKPPPPLPKPPREKSAPQQKAIKIPPFDIQEIPDAMRLEGMPMAAKLMKRWFAGVLNYAPTDDDLAAEINQDGKPYPPDMYDTTTIKMDWVLKFKRAADQYNYLVNNAIYRQATFQPLRDKLMPFRDAATSFDSWDLCKGSMSVLHRHFHFQYVGVGSSLSQKIDDFIESQFQRSGVPDDLTGALGSFNFYAAPAEVKFEHIKREAVISSVYVYIKDSYDFTDKPGDVSQYLGHWSSKGVIVVPYNGLVGQLNVPSLYLPYPVARGDMRVKGNIYYPVHNSDFRQWAIKHQRGGDFIIFSDRKRCRLRTPIRIKL